MAIKKKGAPETEQRTLIAVLLCMVLYTVYTSFFAPAPPPVAEVPVAEEGTPSVGEQPVASDPVPAPVAVSHTERPWSTPLLSGTFTSADGGPTDVVFPEQPGPLNITPIWTMVLEKIKGESEGEWKPYGDDPGPQRLLTDGGSLLMAGTGEGFVDGEYSVSGADAITATRKQGALRIQKVYTASPDDPSRLSARLTFENTGSTPIDGPLWFGTADNFDEMGGMMSRYSSFYWPFGHADGDLEQPGELEDLDEDGPDRFEGPVSWYGTGDRYFVAMTMIPEDKQSWGELTFSNTADGRHGVFVVHDGPLAAGETTVLELDLYTGARDVSILETLGETQGEAVDLGFFGVFARLLLGGLKLIEGVIGNWGWSIMLLTFFINIAFWPLMKKSYESGQKMKLLQPKIEAMKERFKDDPQRQGQEQMKLFQEEGVNPLGGCLPMLLRMPVLFALYSVLLYSVDVYHADWFYLKDLSVADPTAILPLIVGLMMFGQQAMTPIPSNMDKTQAKMMRLMPFMFVAFMFVFPAGLALYVCVNTSMSILQMWLVKRRFSTQPPAAAK
jgi:YidC/Oxa1 family membrane protein insertase